MIDRPQPPHRPPPLPNPVDTDDHEVGPMSTGHWVIAIVLVVILLVLLGVLH